MANDAERARRLVADLLHLGCNCDVAIYSVEIERTAALLAEVRLEEAKCHGGECRDEMLWRKTIAQVRLEEAKWWKKFYLDEVGVADSESDRRLAELERAAGAGK